MNGSPKQTLAHFDPRYEKSAQPTVTSMPVKGSNCKFEPRTVGPLRGYCRHLTFSLGILVYRPQAPFYAGMLRQVQNTKGFASTPMPSTKA